MMPKRMITIISGTEIQLYDDDGIVRENQAASGCISTLSVSEICD